MSKLPLNILYLIITTYITAVISGAIFVQNPLGFWQRKSATRDPNFLQKNLLAQKDMMI
jgi:hypothetical protein